MQPQGGADGRRTPTKFEDPQYWRPRADLYKALSGLDSCIAITLHAHAVMPVMVPAGQVFSHALGVFASQSYGLLALLSGAPHYWWAIARGSTMKGDLRYTPTDVFETWVRPNISDELTAVGVRLDQTRSALMVRRQVGITGIYHLVHDVSVTDPAIEELRSIHRDIDIATVKAYGWDDLLEAEGGLDHGFHETDQGIRYTIGLVVRTEILDRLRELNHQAYADEVYLGLHKKPKKHPDMPPPSAEARRKKAERLAGKATGKGFDDDGLFPPGNALF